MLYYTLERLGDTEKNISRKSKGLLSKKLTTFTTTNNSLSPSIKWYGDSHFCLIFKGSCLKQTNKQTKNFHSSKQNNLFIVYELHIWSRDLNFDFTPKDCLFGGVKLAKKADPDK